MVAPNGDVLAVWSFRTTNTYIPNQAQAAFFTGDIGAIPSQFQAMSTAT